MRNALFFLFVCFSITATSQTQADSLRMLPDSLIKERLVQLVMDNPALHASDAMVGTAEYELKRAKTSWLNTINVSGNLNELVINNATINGLPASTLFPKYNFGLTIPLGLFGRQEKNIAREKIRLYEAQYEENRRALVKRVLIRYEEFKEKRELFELQRQMTDGQLATYQNKQRDFASGKSTDPGEINKEYQLYVEQKSKQRTREMEYNVARLELEELIGMRLEDALLSLTATK